MIFDVATNVVNERGTYELEVEANRSLWLWITFDRNSRDISVSMLVAFVKAVSRESTEMEVKSVGCVARIEAASKDNIDRANDLMSRIVESALQGLDIDLA